MRTRWLTRYLASSNKWPAFWFWFTVKVVLGIGQMAGALVTVFLIMKQGFSTQAFWSFVLTTILTTTSMILFKVVRWHPVTH